MNLQRADDLQRAVGSISARASSRPVTQLMDRVYRIVAASYRNPPRTMSVADRVDHAEHAERRLRTRLAAGERPDVVLIAPERAVRSGIGRDGTLTEACFAWSPDHVNGDLSYSWLHAPRVLGTLEVDRWHRDPVSDLYAANGSVVVTAGRLASLTIAPGLAPVAERLRERYGVPVTVVPGEDVPPPRVESAPALVIPSVLTRGEVMSARRHFARELRRPTVGRVPDRYGITRPISHPPSELVDLAGDLLLQVGDHFGLPVDHVTSLFAAYDRGDGFPLHQDICELASTHDRTVSFSVMLSEPGEHFRGGDLLVNGEPVKARIGDLVGFTAATPHEVTTVTSGRRAAWIAFGEVW